MVAEEASTFTLFRTDIRPFSKGNFIPPPGDHINRMGGGDARLGEERLRAFSPLLLELRTKNLFVYTTLYAATVQHIQYGGHVYQVEVEHSDILHTADLTLIDEVGRASESEYPKLAQLYLDQHQRGSRIVESIVRKARVLTKLYDKTERSSVYEALKTQAPDRDTDFGRLLSTPVPNS
jgi:hypothetical protein